MKKFLFIAFYIILVNNAFSQSYNKPESVDFDTASGRYFIANCASGAGRIQVREPNGTLNSLTTSAISPSPYGIEFASGKLYACCGTSVKVFNPVTGALISTLSMPGASFLNGITHDNNENVYVTDFSALKIFKIRPNNSVSVFVSNTSDTPNGIIFDEPNNRLIYVCWGGSAKIKAVSISDSTQSTIITTNLSSIDGIAKDGQGNYYVSNWGANSVVKYDNLFANPQTVVTGLTSPADLFYNTLTDTLAIPNSTASGSVTFWGNPQSTVGEIALDKSKTQIDLYPNPFNNIVFVDLKDEKMTAFELTDMAGRKFNIEQINSNNTSSFDLKNIPSGNYILSIQTKSGKKINKRIQKN